MPDVSDQRQEMVGAVAPVAGTRNFVLDWLRALVVLGLIPYHAAVVFTIGPGDYVKSPQRSLAFDLAATLVSFWGMPLLFLVAGASTWYALGRRSPRRFVGERLGRLFIPFIFGVLTLVPIQLYLDRRATAGYNLNYAQFYLRFLVEWAHIAQQGVFGLGFQYWGHLWFLLYLLAVSLFLLPLLLWLRGTQASAFIARLASHCDAPLVFFLLLGAPFVLVEVALSGPVGPLPYADYTSLYSGPAGLVLYAMAFVVGYLLFATPHFRVVLLRYRRNALTLGIVALGLHEVLLGIFGAPLVGAPLGMLLIRVLRASITSFLLAAILGFALRYLADGTPALRYLNEACLPVYAMHMPILTAIGFSVVSWDIPLVLKFLILVTTTAAVTLALYEGVVRRIPALRFIFGMKPSGEPLRPHQRLAAQPGASHPGATFGH